MAVRYAVANGNWSNTATWDGGTLPTSSDDVYSNNKQISINQNISVLSLNNGAASGITAGGYFQPTVNCTIVADTFNCSINQLILIRDAVVTITITGNNFNGPGNAIYLNNVNSTVTVNGQINGSNSSGNSTIFILAGTITINGNAYAGTQNNAIGISYQNVLNCTINGFCLSSSTRNALANSSNNANIIIQITKAITIDNGLAAVSNSSKLATIIVKEIEQGNFGEVPITGYIRLSTASGAYYKGLASGSTFRTLSDPADIAGQVPAPSDVRFGVTYQSGAKTGTAYIPPAASVGVGVPVDNTVGTAALTPASVWNYVTSNLTTAGSIGERLKNASTVDTTGDQLAALL